ncbi:MAG: DNA-binding response regulator [Desulfobacterium sp.]|nr:DNA-binding response regulator [Desulfobacterium sp.]
MKPTILIIDDDEKLNQLIRRYLDDFGFHTISAVHPKNGLEKLARMSPDLVILDIMLPDMNGFEVCKTIRSQSNVPIIMLTARGELMDRVVGLELGADDYLPKPFEPRELVARIQSILRRAGNQKVTSILQFGKLVIDLDRQTVKLDGDLLPLTTHEFTALSLLAKHPGKVMNRDTILQELRGIDCDAFNRSVDITMSRLRQKLKDDPRTPSFIKTIWGTGYLFIGGEEKDGQNEIQ